MPLYMQPFGCLSSNNFRPSAALQLFTSFTIRFRTSDTAFAGKGLCLLHPLVPKADQGSPTMSFAPAISFFAPDSFFAPASFFAPDRDFLPPRKKPVRRALPPPPPREEPQNSFKERMCRRLLAMDPILFMTSLLLVICGLVVGLWDAMGLVLPL
jgi:hypothetical protein